MLWLGIILTIFGVLGAVFKGHVVWSAAHCPHGGGGVPTLDFPLFWPFPIAAGISVVLVALNLRTFPGFGLICYLGLTVMFGVIHWQFGRIGELAQQKKRDSQSEIDQREDATT